MGDGAGFERTLNGLAEHWAQLATSLDGAQRAGFAELLAALAAEQPGVPDWTARNGLRALLLQVLSRGHPLRRIVLFETRSGTAATEDVVGVAAELLRRLAEPTVPDAAEVRVQATHILITMPAFSESDLRRAALDPSDPALLRLERDDGGGRWPRFQFGADGVPIPLVLEINRVLDAEDDPWGVADWWLLPNAWLGDAPARLIGRVADADLLSVARSVGV